jgi:hypothetical protein
MAIYYNNDARLLMDIKPNAVPFVGEDFVVPILTAMTADGEIVIKNETPRIKSGVREIIDNTHRGKSAFKEEIEASVDEGTGERRK